ncbi:hypothetical protein C8R46DRAFT_1061993 [Mycena filopes]|nr:hypothetical protein C8R46DRAFT_1061993 [Mycena filopes]
MRLPQELVDSILDAFTLISPDASHNDPAVESTLKSCALVSRAFARPSQRKLFSSVQLSHHPHYHKRFLALLTSSPHIGTFVRRFEAAYKLSKRHPISRILSALPRLERVILNANAKGLVQQTLREFPAFLQACVLAFSLPTVRRIELGNLTFSDVLELESLLRGSTGLKELVLSCCVFVKDDAPVSPANRSILLDSLELFGFANDRVTQSMIDSFAVVDITRLRTLRLLFSSPHSIVAANAATLENVDIKYQQGMYYRPFVPNVFSGDSNLQCICLDAWVGDTFAPLLHSFGRLNHLSTITMHIRHPGAARSDAHWVQIDEALAGLQSLTEITIYIYYRERWGEAVNLADQFPSMAEKGLLHLIHINFVAQ